MTTQPGIPMTELHSFSTFEERRDDEQLRDCWVQSRASLEERASRDVELYCGLCRQPATYRFGGKAFDPREQLCCGSCGLNARIRAGVLLLDDALPHAADLYMTEQATPAYAWMQRRHPALRGSEFEHDPAARERLAAHLASLGGNGPVKYEDVTALSFDSAMLDAIVSFDVLEHVPDYRAALREFARVLRQGGVLIATFPFTDHEQTIVRARMQGNGEIEHLLEPEYHGDPISGGVLCFYHFGWDVLDAVREAGFSDARMVMPWAPGAGLEYGLWTLVARR
ncbi:MAG: class I SAM-dependent methyltransferase [Luteimonas sp.]